MAEVAGDAERHRQVEMADPKAIDTVQRRDAVDVVDAFRRFDQAEEGRALVGGGEFVGDRARTIAVVRDLQRDAAPARRVIFHRVDDVRACSTVPTIGAMRPSTPMSMARAMKW